MSRAKVPATEVRVEYVPLRELQRWPRNPKKHDDASIRASISRFGYIQPIVVDERTGRIVAGHGRLDALAAMRDQGKDPPARIRPADGDWLAPVLRGVEFKTKHEAEAFLLADNQLTTLGGWDDAGLAEVLKELTEADVPVLGWSTDDIKGILAQAEADSRGPLDGDLDDAPEPPAEADCYVKPGDLWQLGQHRILCGDSTKAEDVARLMGGERAGLMNTDPPYGVAYANDERPNPGVAKPRVANDDLSDANLQAFLEDAFRVAVDHALTPNAAWYMWHAHLTQGYFAAAAAAANVVLHRQIIWVKPVLLLGRGQYHWKHEPCFMGWVKGNQPPDYGAGHGERNQTTVWEVGSVTQAERKEFNHSSPKPVGLFEIPMVKHLKAGEIAYEPFSGSAPQIIAAEKTARRCFAMELEPRYVQVAIERWQKATNQTATRIPEGSL